MLFLTRAQVQQIDRQAIEKYGIPALVLMENAARAVADQAVRMLGGNGCVLVFCGRGNNGGDGLAAARHLHNRGLSVAIVPCFDPARLSPEAAVNWRIIQAMKIEQIPLEQAGKADLLIDALLGIGATSPPRQPISQAIQCINQSGCRVLAVDLPSGLDCDTGLPLDQCVRADCTVSFVAPKAGFANPASRQYTGEVVVGDIGCPRELIEQVAQSARRDKM